VSVSRRVSRVCSSSIVTPHAKGSIGRPIKYKIECKRCSAELHDEALFKYPLAKEDCPICFLPMPAKMICCISLQPATVSSVPIEDFANANQRLIDMAMDNYYTCWGKSICTGCIHSFCKSGNNDKCPFCNSDQASKTREDNVAELLKRVEAQMMLVRFVPWVIVITTD